MKWICYLGFVVFITYSTFGVSADGKLLATAGLNQVEGSGGGGIVPWATLSGYDSREQISVSAFMTQVSVDDFRLNVLGASVSLYDRVEISLARHRFEVEPLSTQITQNVMGAKVRLYGDVVYSTWPQLSVGIQYKDLQDTAIARALGSAADSGADYYLAATKVHLGAVGGYNLIWNLTGRFSRANQMGLLGQGAEGNDNYEFLLEGSLGVLLSRSVAIGMEYRQKPDKLNLGEEDWWDLFIAYIPNKSFNVTLAWANLGNIAGIDDQQGVYLSLGGQL